jgi:catalase
LLAFTHILDSPNGVEKGNLKGSGVINTNFTIETCRSTLFDGLIFPNGNEQYLQSLQQGRVIHFVREAFGHFKTIGAAGGAVSWLAHKCLPGNVRSLALDPFAR